MENKDNHTEQKGWREALKTGIETEELTSRHFCEEIEYDEGTPFLDSEKVEAFIEHTLQKDREEKQRCGKDMGDGSICRVILDCHLHDWRQKEALLAYQEELVKKIAAQKDNYNCYECGADGYNEGIDAALSLIKDTKI